MKHISAVILFFSASACGSASGDRGNGSGIGVDSVGTTSPGGGTDQSESHTEAGSSPTEGGEDGSKFDLGVAPDLEGGCGDVDGVGGVTFSYIWIANSAEGTVSKIDTVTGVEEGRYRTAVGSASPSRTSVNQFGAVAVGNRVGAGHVTKIAAVEEDCVDNNGNGVIETSTGPGNVLPFMQDECAIWSTPMPILSDGPRGIAWEGGELDPVTCTNTVPNPRLWVAYDGTPQQVYRLDGDTGVVIDTVLIPAITGLIYGGAVNADGDLWLVNRGANTLIRVDAVTLAHETFLVPSTPYGMSVDANGDPWVNVYENGALLDHVYRFDVATSSFVDAGGIGGSYRGMNMDREGRAWVAGNKPCRLAVFDVAQSSLIDDLIPLPGCSNPVGVSVDHDGFVWVVDEGTGNAYKVDPDSHAIVLTVGGLVGPYTYSDMTGAGLDLVINPPG